MKARDLVQWKLAPLLYFLGDDAPLPEVTLHDVCLHLSSMASSCDLTHEPQKVREAIELLIEALPRLERPWLHIAKWLGLEVEAYVVGLTDDGLVGAMEIYAK